MWLTSFLYDSSSLSRMRPYHCRVVCKLHNVIGGEPRAAVMGHRGEEQWTQHTALQGSRAHRDDLEEVVPHLHSLKSISKRVQQPVTQEGVGAQVDQFVYQVLWNDECKMLN